ncbi:hypothetical protein [Actinomadura rudentiformis]|uniref:Uncharacterized protein n=1 Tax=Actinomadura rudentiformis TaxID=359158 RepID=A0A6H9YS32_9ACTN|nr:hypothetical protein [Actinomadura rudentiformis]KAB2344699.1 hypothetical protein F8566_29220 [Actinomadura rudentiformis]
MSSPLPRLARQMTATGVVVASLGAAAALTAGTAVAGDATANTGTANTAITANGTDVAEAKAPRVRSVKLSPRQRVVYPRGAPLRTTKHFRKIYIKVVQRQYNRPVRVRAILPNGRPMGPWITVPSRTAPQGRTVPLTKVNVRDGVRFKLQWAPSTARSAKFYLYF